MYHTGGITLLTAQDETISFDFTPGLVEFRVAKKYTTDNDDHISVGFFDGERQNVTSTFNNGTTKKAISRNDRVVDHWETISGVPTQVLEIEALSFEPYGLNVRVHKGANYSVYITAWPA